jgi:hypothetical protein
LIFNYLYHYKFIVLDYDTPSEKVINYLYTNRNDSLQIPKPQFILSIIGGARDFKIDQESEKSFKTGLMKVAKIHGSWIITGGIDSGIMKIIGEASDEDSNSNLTLLGITSRRRVYGSYPTLKRNFDSEATEKNKRFLNQHHSTFIFVNDKEDEFRTKLEKHLKETLNVPFFLLAINGGFKTLEIILNSLNQTIPIVLVAVNFHKY